MLLAPLGSSWVFVRAPGGRRGPGFPGGVLWGVPNKQRRVVTRQKAHVSMRRPFGVPELVLGAVYSPLSPSCPEPLAGTLAKHRPVWVKKFNYRRVLDRTGCRAAKILQREGYGRLWGAARNRDPFCPNGLKCSWMLLGDPEGSWVLCGAPGSSRGARLPSKFGPSFSYPTLYVKNTDPWYSRACSWGRIPPPYPPPAWAPCRQLRAFTFCFGAGAESQTDTGAGA